MTAVITPNERPRLRVAILEPRMEGHHPSYLRWMTEGLVEAGHEMTIVTDATELSHPELAALELAGYPGLRIVGLPYPPELAAIPRTHATVMARELKYRNLLGRWYGEISESSTYAFVFLPYLDYSAYGIALAGSPFGRTPWGGVVMRPTFHLQTMGVKAPVRRGDALKALLFRRLLRTRGLAGLLTTDVLLSDYLGGSRVPIEPLHEPVNPPVTDCSTARRNLQLSIGPGKKLILVYGAISARKGVRQLLEAIASDTSDTVVLLAGKLDEPSRQLLDTDLARDLIGSGALMVRDRYHDASEELDLFSASDIIWLGYIGHYTSSGVLALAGIAGKPVIACEAGLIGQRTEGLQMGITVDPENIDQVRQAVDELVHDASLAEELGHNGKAYFSACTYERAKKSVVSLVERASTYSN